MQNAAMARALGVNTDRIYMLTFSLGAGLAGFSGALLAPTTSIAPFMGQQFVAPAFITVVVGGATNVIAGALGSQPAPVAGQHAGRLPVRRLPRHSWRCCSPRSIIIRLMPDGISAWLQKRLDRGTRTRLSDGHLAPAQRTRGYRPRPAVLARRSRCWSDSWSGIRAA